MLKVIHLNPIFFDTVRALQNHHKAYGWYPTYRELCKTLNLKSTSAVSLRMKKLQQMGVLKRFGNTPRAYEFTCDMIVLDIDYG